MAPRNPPHKALERVPEERQLFDLRPDHKVRQLAAIHTFRPDLQRQIHPHAIGAEPEKDPLAHAEHAAIAPDQVESQRENGKRQELAELIQPKVGEMQPGVFGRQHIQQREDDE